MNPSLYEQDYYLWLQQTVRQLEKRTWNELDISKEAAKAKP
jgi:predicted unusual protein kinase regulating ubiquinone biosynthesis (AarF/ABC1/UbiB family)